MSAERSRWAVVLGASSGFGEACSIALARAGWNIFGVHLDRKATQANADRIVAEIAASGRRAEFFNVNAADDTKRSEVVAAIASTCGGDPPEARVSVFLHSLAFGTLKPFFGASREASIAKAQLEMTVDVMANSLVYWERSSSSMRRVTSPILDALPIEKTSPPDSFAIS